MKKAFDTTTIILLLVTLICGASCASVQNTAESEVVTADVTVENTEKTEEWTEYISPDAIDMAKASFAYSSHVIEGDEQFNTDSVFSYDGQTYIRLPEKAKEQYVSPFVNVVRDGQNRLGQQPTGQAPGVPLRRI